MIRSEDPKVSLAASNRVSSVLLLVSALLLVLGSVMPWASVAPDVAQEFGLEDSESGWADRAGDIGDGPFFVVLAVALGTLGLLGLRGTVNLGTKVTAILVSVLGLLLGVYEVLRIAADSQDFADDGFTDPLTVEYGLFVLLLGAVLGLAGAIAQRRRPKA